MRSVSTACALILTTFAAQILAATDLRADDDPTFFNQFFSWFNPNGQSDQNDQKKPLFDGVPYEVTITVSGDDSLTSTLTDASNLKSLQEVTPSGVAGLIRRAIADRPRLRAALYGQGYFAGVSQIKVAGFPPDQLEAFAAVEKARKAGPVPVTIHVVTGQRFNYGKLTILNAASKQPLKDMPSTHDLRLDPGQPASADQVFRAEQAIVDHLRNEGHPFAKIASRDIVADHATRELDMTFTVDPGPSGRFGHIEVKGTQDLDRNFVERQIDIERGEPYSPDRLARIRRRLVALPAVGAVRIQEAQQLDSHGELPVTIDVIERLPHFVGANAKYSNTEGGAVNVFWGDRNLWGHGESLRIDGYGSWYGGALYGVPNANRLGYKLAATFNKPDIITPQDELIAQAAILREVTSAYVREAATFQGGVRHRFSDELSLQIGADIEYSRSQDNPLYPRNDFTAGVPFDLLYDTTDSPLDPSRGMRITATLEPFASLGQNGPGPVMGKAVVSAYHALDEDRRYIVAGRVGAGSIVGANLYAVPPQRRFYIGGGGTLRGFGYQQASPHDGYNNLIGGLSFFMASAELRARITDTIGIVPFIDAGEAFRGSLPTLSTIRYAAGLGLRYYTPVGPIRLDVGVPIDRQPGDSHYGVYISIGQAF
ncbi:autotransporter assembly complex protein TamA [Beijerinckia indica]|uniref:Surface antigen (D15) n=1 Tax=Beijerinckia indica subsp. indica (strain ATCC 9039 / DSM 1715 / NCIMB 8712) TaxID=395963 RepID=B2ICS2_BEII9|nr:autotransporter assembly complex family protein [Beijerinckia indica]ACB95346.1 surface antigen (D15) [Beijerinckia indica subsp. indica ATCC 9039]